MIHQIFLVLKWLWSYIEAFFYINKNKGVIRYYRIKDFNFYILVVIKPSFITHDSIQFAVYHIFLIPLIESSQMVTFWKMIIHIYFFKIVSLNYVMAGKSNLSPPIFFEHCFIILKSPSNNHGLVPIWFSMVFSWCHSSLLLFISFFP